MAIQFLQEQGPGGKIGEALGTGLGTGLGQGLQALATMKLRELSQRQRKYETAKGFEALGYTPEESSKISGFDPDTQKVIAQEKIRSNQRSIATGPGLKFAIPGLSDEESQAIGGLPASLQAQYYKNYLQTLGERPEQAAAKAASVLQEPQKATVAEEIAQPEKKIEVTPSVEKTKTVAEKAADIRAKQAEEKKIAESFKMSKDERKEILQRAASARQNLTDLERIEELEQAGQLSSPGYVEFLKRSGLDIPALTGADSEELNKIAVNFLRDAKAYFGGRVSNYEVAQFLKTIPSLSQSPEGRKRVISNLKRIARTSVEYANSLKEIISENKGIIPYDFLEKIDSKVEKKLDVISAQFKKDLDKEVPAAQNKAVTALYAVLGSAAGIPGKLLGKAAGLLGGGGGAALLEE